MCRHTFRLLLVVSTLSRLSVADDSNKPTTDTWPSFRGTGARGLAIDQSLPDQWDGESDKNIRWMAAIPGLANSAPVVWKDRTFVTTAVGTTGDSRLRIGNYGAGDAANDDSEHSWRLYCLDTTTGETRWYRKSYSAVPPVRRHTKSSHANSTPATDGKHVVALYNTGGMYCYDMDGRLMWSQQIGLLDSGAFDVPELQWGFGSSPIIFGERVFVQCDIQQGSFVAAYDIATGVEVWKSERNELPSWGTPTIHQTEQGPLLIANGTRFVRGYDADTGSERWKLSGNSYITVPTPFVADGLIFVTSGYRPIQPIHAIRLDASGNLSSQSETSSGESVAWSLPRGGTYIPTPIVVDKYLYTLSGYGILTCYEASTGTLKYRRRVGNDSSASYTASPVSADGMIYLTAESGDVAVVAAGPEFELVAENSIGAYCLATPAIASGQILFRTTEGVVSVGRSRTSGR